MQVISAVFGIRPRPGLTLEASIVESLRTRRALVVFDNCEHLLGDVARLTASLLRDCAHVVVVATSREALGIAGEQTWPVTSLDLPGASDVSDCARERKRASLRRSRPRRPPGFAIVASNAAAVVEICRRLDGIPLAIELAAARTATLSPSDISGLLDERFRLLTGGRHAAVERHQTLQATVDWSYSLLSDVERTLFDRLSVFAGSFDARAAQAVAEGDGIETWDVLDALTGLVAKSMVVAEEGDDTSMRYQLLETLRQYGRERLDDRGESDWWRRRHADHYAAVAEETGLGLRGRDEFVWMRRLITDLDDLRSAVNWSLDRDDDADVEYTLRIVAALIRGVNADRRMALADWATRAAGRVDATTPARRASVLAAAATAHMLVLGDREHARVLASRVLDEPIGPSYAGSMAYAILATAAMNEGDVAGAATWASNALSECEDLAIDDFELAGRYMTATVFEALGGDPNIARAHAELGLEAARRLGNPSQLAGMLWASGYALERQDPAAALRAFAESAALVRVGANDTNFGATLAHLATLRDQEGDHSGALRDLLEAVDYFERSGPARRARGGDRAGEPPARARRTARGLCSSRRGSDRRFARLHGGDQHRRPDGSSIHGGTAAARGCIRPCLRARHRDVVRRSDRVRACCARARARWSGDQRCLSCRPGRSRSCSPTSRVRRASGRTTPKR